MMMIRYGRSKGWNYGHVAILAQRRRGTQGGLSWRIMWKAGPSLFHGNGPTPKRMSTCAKPCFYFTLIRFRGDTPALEGFRYFFIFYGPPGHPELGTIRCRESILYTMSTPLLVTMAV